MTDFSPWNIPELTDQNEYCSLQSRPFEICHEEATSAQTYLECASDTACSVSYIVSMMTNFDPLNLDLIPIFYLKAFRTIVSE